MRSTESKQFGSQPSLLPLSNMGVDITTTSHHHPPKKKPGHFSASSFFFFFSSPCPGYPSAKKCTCLPEPRTDQPACRPKEQKRHYFTSWSQIMSSVPRRKKKKQARSSTCNTFIPNNTPKVELLPSSPLFQTPSIPASKLRSLLEILHHPLYHPRRVRRGSCVRAVDGWPFLRRVHHRRRPPVVGHRLGVVVHVLQVLVVSSRRGFPRRGRLVVVTRPLVRRWRRIAMVARGRGGWRRVAMVARGGRRWRRVAVVARGRGIRGMAVKVVGRLVCYDRRRWSKGVLGVVCGSVGGPRRMYLLVGILHGAGSDGCGRPGRGMR